MSFVAAMIAAGLRPRDVVADGRWRRCATEDKPRKKNGCYLLDPSGRRGVFKNYAVDADWHRWQDDTVTTSQAAEIERRAAELRRREHRKRVAAIEAMRAYFASLSPLRGGHQYLFDKGLSMRGCEGLRVDGDLLVIPMFRGRALMSYQTITPGGEKKYRYGCPIKGNAYILGGLDTTVTCLCEGFATGLAIYQSMGSARVVVCFDAGNMVNVAREIDVRGLVVVCADNDWQTEQRIGSNPGIQKGTAAADAIGCGVAAPEGIDGSDWADALKEGWTQARVRMEIMRSARFVAREAVTQ